MLRQSRLHAWFPVVSIHWAAWFVNMGLLLLFSSLTGASLAASVQEYSVKAALVLNLARFTEWPVEVFSGDQGKINFCLIGDEAALETFTEIDQKPVGNKTLTVIRIVNIERLQNCHLLYVDNLNTAKIRRLHSESLSQHMLTIGEHEDFLSNGGMINLNKVETKIGIQVNLGTLRAAGLQLSARVLKLATVINP